MKELADDNFKFDENGRKLSKQVENTVGIAEIARSEQFLLFPQCFQMACFSGVSKGVVVWEWVYNCPSIGSIFLGHINFADFVCLFVYFSVCFFSQMTLISKNRSYHKEYTSETLKLYHIIFKSYD